MKQSFNFSLSSFFKRVSWMFLLLVFSLLAEAQSYEQLWKRVEDYQQKDLPRSAMQQLVRIYEKAKGENNVAQLMRAQLARAAEQVKLTPDSAAVEVERLRSWAASEGNPVTAALLHHVMGNIEMQQNEPDWKTAMETYRLALKDKELLLQTSADAYVPMTVSTLFSKRYFQDNLYDLLVHQTIAGLMANWQWSNRVEVQEFIIDLYDSLIDVYGVKGLERPTAALLAHEAKLVFLTEDRVADNYRLSPEKAELSLRELLRFYEPRVMTGTMDGRNGKAVAMDAVVDVYLKLAESLCNQQKLAEAMLVLQQAEKRYPKTSLKEDIRAKMAWIDAPSLAMEVPVVYPNYNGRMVVNYKNIKEVKLETYRIQLTPDAPELRGNLSRDVLCRTYGKKVETQHFRLPATTDYQARMEALTYQLPAAGIYMLKVVPVGRKAKAAYQLLYVSPYQALLVPLLDGRTEVVAIDRLTGNPVPYAEVVEYRLAERGNRFVVSQVWRTNQQGSVILNTPARTSLYMNVRTPRNDYMQIASMYPGRDYRGEGWDTWREQTTLFTDRSLYRPGQVVHVSGIRYEQLGDSLRTLQGKVMNVELLDVNGKQVSEASAMSDWFGVFSVDFTLPQQVLPGKFTLRTKGKTLGIRVENYKRPTFDISFDPVTMAYTFGDEVTVKGKVQTFAGAPVRLGKGTYTIVRSEAWLWRQGGPEVKLTSGSFTTDASGRFSIDMLLEEPLNQQKAAMIPYYKYTVRATVTDGAGETQVSELTLPVGKQSIGLQIQGLKAKLPCEHKEKIQFQVMNLNKQLVRSEVSYQVYRLETRKLQLSDKRGRASSSVLQTEDQLSKRTLVFEGKAMSQEAFVPFEIYALPAGKYQLKATVRDAQGRQVTTSQDFILFSLMDKRPPIQTIQWFYQDGENWDNGKKVTFYVGSSEENVYMLMDVYTSKQRIRSERFKLTNAMRRFEFAYDERYGDGLVVHFAFMREGKLYTKMVRLEKPKPQKQLTLKWESFRDQLIPGQQEVWRLKVTDASGQPVDANLLATLYDASLDKLQTHQWWLQPYFNRWLPYVGVRSIQEGMRALLNINFPYLENKNGYPVLNRDTYSRLRTFLIWNKPYYFYPTTRAYASPVYALKSAVPSYGARNNVSEEVINDGFVSMDESGMAEVIFEEEVVPTTDKRLPQVLRTNFAETAFFYPMLRTDEKGEVTLSFTLPDALTEWKFMGLAHTQHMDCGQLVSKVKSSKPFMVQPNLPRFVRVGDASALAVSLVNLSMETVNGKVRMELVNPMNDQVVFRQERNFKVAEGETDVAQFRYTVADAYDVLICRVVAEAGEFSDGEQHYLPVLSNREWITETIPFQVKGGESKALSLKHLFNRQSRTATGQRLTVELTANPNWYVIQTLSAISNPTHEDAISWATAYYANALATEMVRKHPRIQQIFRTWMTEGATKETWWSKLEANADLKQVLLTETPWLAEAQTEAEQKRRMAVLFELNGMEERLQLAAQQLMKLQTAEGGWMWYPGMPANRYTTTQVVELMARLQSMGVRLDAAMNASYRRGLDYLKQEVRKEYERLLQKENDTQKTNARWIPSEQTVHYLYICSIDQQAQVAADKKMNAFLIDRILHGGTKEMRSKSFSMYQKALLATIMQVNGRLTEAAVLMQSMKEYLVSTPDMGSYFDTYKAAYSWNSYRIPTHVAVMEAIQRIRPDVTLLDEMKLWLLKQKQVQQWNTPLASVDAVHAFLLGEEAPEESTLVGTGLQTQGKMKAMVGQREVVTPTDALGYIRVTFTDDKLPTHKGKLSLQVEKEGNSVGWGAVYAQYFEEMNKVSRSDDKGLSIEREYRLNGQLLSSKTELHTGDELTVRFIVKTDRDMDFIHITDQRAACMEPASQLSGYVWKNGLGAYRVNRDASTEYFIDKLPKGIHILEYNVFVNRMGTYQIGSATLQSVYAPEFAAHTAGSTLKVEE